tara:strand:- start:275 stop:736 length:462 start_codon:yes stop_codon:yes gene_type:complete
MAISKELIARLREDFYLDWHGNHGSSHWARVKQNGLLLAEHTRADCEVVELFAFIHDSCRRNEHKDPDHGPRAADYAERLRFEKLLELNDMQFQQLKRACAGHTHETRSADITIASCWDADRLDLPRVGIIPDPHRMATEIGARLARARAEQA